MTLSIVRKYDEAQNRIGHSEVISVFPKFLKWPNYWLIFPS